MNAPDLRPKSSDSDASPMETDPSKQLEHQLTDRRLLELAAKAAGITLAHWNDGEEPYSSGQGFILPNNRLWNPLTDDGDSRRLQVACMLGTGFAPGGQAWAAPTFGSGLATYEEYKWREDAASAAMRMAVLRAAAVIGEAMP